MGQRGRINLKTSDDTVSFGETIGRSLKPNSILALTGDLGAGKTTFVQGLLNGLGIQDTAQSPTFTYMQIYDALVPVYHFDLYRLKTERDFIMLGFDEFLTAGGIAVIEWPERIPTLLPSSGLLIQFSYENKGRSVLCTTWDER